VSTRSGEVGAQGKPASKVEGFNDVLIECGDEVRAASATITLAKTPFPSVVQDHTALVCGMNPDLMSEPLEGLSSGTLQAHLTTHTR
jgi:hypothetical protein